MWDSIYFFIMVPMVYIAFATLVIGIAFKFTIIFISPTIKGTIAVFPKGSVPKLCAVRDSFFMPSAFMKDKPFWVVIIAFHAAFLLLIIGHLELIREFAVIQVIPHEVFLGAGWVGIVLIVTTIYFLFRRFKTPWREISVPEDFIILLLLFLTFIFGSHMSLASRYGIAGFDIQVSEYREYLSSLFTTSPHVSRGILASPHYVIVALHVFFANLFMMMFPFSKMIHSVFMFAAQFIKRK
ncbi:MAG TPA: respiratory nitrate reductase subunit gamma [Spirochaetota bacterium]|nr:respiratory nitrate reductase subunit gamma [Spirochaetota bacterium]